MQKSLTLSEALITLAILGVLAAILIPVINNVRPDKDKVTYKKALYSLQTAVSNAMDSTLYEMAMTQSTGDWGNGPDLRNITDAAAFCEEVADALNTSGAINCSGPWDCADDDSGEGGSCYSSPNFITTDGIRFWNLEGTFTGTTKQIYVDRNLGDNELNAIRNRNKRSGSGQIGLKIQVWFDGKTGTPDDGDYEYENELIENSLQVTSGAGT